MVQKQVKKALKQKKRKYPGEVGASKKMNVSDSEQESINSSSSIEGEVLKLGSGELYNFNNNHSSKNVKQHKERFSNLDDCINV